MHGSSDCQILCMNYFELIEGIDLCSLRIQEGNASNTEFNDLRKIICLRKIVSLTFQN